MQRIILYTLNSSLYYIGWFYGFIISLRCLVTSISLFLFNIITWGDSKWNIWTRMHWNQPVAHFLSIIIHGCLIELNGLIDWLNNGKCISIGVEAVEAPHTHLFIPSCKTKSLKTEIMRLTCTYIQWIRWQKKKKKIKK